MKIQPSTSDKISRIDSRSGLSRELNLIPNTSLVGISGATGFIGKALTNSLAIDPTYRVRGLVRKGTNDSTNFVVGEIGPSTVWESALSGVKVLVHCAAHVHQAGRQEDASKYGIVNTEGTLSLARSAAKIGVERFIFISSVKVMGESTPTNHPFQISDVPAPNDLYGASKWEAEQGLWELAKLTGMEVVVIRPPLVYGPGVGANFRQLMRWVAQGHPLPLGSIRNKRSMVALPNLIHLIKTCLTHESAAGNTFFVSDGQDLSTAELVEALGQALGRSPMLLPVPAALLTLGARLLGRPEAAFRLTQSLQVSIRHTQQTLNWNPPCSVEDGMRFTAQEYLGK